MVGIWNARERAQAGNKKKKFVLVASFCGGAPTRPMHSGQPAVEEVAPPLPFIDTDASSTGTEVAS
jgi:hypothetical protein